MTNFCTPTNTDFYPVLRKRVKLYFQQRKISQYGGWQQVFTTISLLLMLFVPYVLILSGAFGLLTMLLFAGIMGLAIAGLGMAVMHNANHGSLSSHPTTSKIIGFVVYGIIIGGNPITWKLQHNLLHHRYTNIYGKDEDLDPYGTMRFSPEAKYKSHYRFQHLYAIGLYGLLTLVWALHKEFFQLMRYRKMGLLKTDASLYKNLAILVLSKCFYFGYLMILPILLLNITLLQWLIAFFVFHFISGLLISIIFQLAHVGNKVNFPVLNSNGDVDNQWAIQQIQTTANFSPQNRLMFWFIGGLNFQIEHHLFPNIHPTHYKEIGKIVRKTATEFGLPYYSYGSLFQAIKAHFQFLKHLGQPLTSTNDNMSSTSSIGKEFKI